MSDKNEKFNVLFVNNSADLYGASRCLVSYIRGLDRSRVNPLVVLPEEGPLTALLAGLGVDVLLHPPLAVVARSAFNPRGLVSLGVRLPLSAIRLAAIIRRHRIDVVHTNTGVILSPALAAMLTGVAHVWHVREIFDDFRRFWGPLAWFITATSHRVLVISEPVARQFSRREKVTTIHDGVSLTDYDMDVDRHRREFRARFGIGDEMVVGCVGRIKLVRKGQDDLVRAAAVLKGRGVRVKFLIVGSPFPGNEEHLARLEQMIAGASLQDDFIFTGEMADVRPAYAAMDVLAHPPARPEPFGMVLLEAMALGVPVIATRHGGPVEIVMDGETGFLVTPSASDELADAIEKLAADPPLRRSFGAAARRRIETRFTASAAVQRIEDVYAQLVTPKAGLSSVGKHSAPSESPH